MQTYPLAWPDGWPRTPLAKQQSGQQFTEEIGGFRRTVSFARARGLLLVELRRLGALHIVVSSNRRPGFEESSRTGDDGVAVYFTLDGRPMVMACDRYMLAAANMSSIRLAVEAMRQLGRHGGGTMRQRAFQGFEALPPPKSYWEVLGLRPGATVDEVRRAHRAKAASIHPDVEGGSNAAMAELNAARDAALKGA